jgi:uncharacterized PurR-regulated membrane protein YhhQ (DUF165 family)
VVLGIAFYIGPIIDPSNGEPWTLAMLLSIGTGNYIYKFIVAVALTPVIYLGHSLIDTYLGPEKSEEMKKAAMRR